MTRLKQYWLSKPALLSLLLAALVLRGLVPAGFMPSSDRPFTLEICRAGFAATILHVDIDRASSGHASNVENCVFGFAPAMGPAAQAVAAAAVAPAASSAESAFTLPVFSTQRFRIAQPRAPPVFS